MVLEVCVRAADSVEGSLHKRWFKVKWSCDATIVTDPDVLRIRMCRIIEHLIFMHTFFLLSSGFD